MNFAVVGMGYVGLSLATLLATKYQVFAVDIYQERVDKINKRISPLNDKEIIRFFKEKDLKLIATLDYKKSLYKFRLCHNCNPNRL